MDEEYDLVRGQLQLKRNEGGFRHFIEVDGKHRDIRCGAYMEVQLLEWEDEENGPGVLRGHYEAHLTEPVKAYLVLGSFSRGEIAQVTIPLGATVRVKK